MENLRTTVTEDEVRLAGNEAVMAGLLADDDDENDPVSYEDEDDEGEYEPDLTYVETDADRAEDLISDPDYLAMRAEGYSHLEAVESVEAERRGEPPFLQDVAQHLDLTKLASVKESADSDPHAYGHPNYGGTESPEHNFFDVFRTSGQEDGHYSIDVPLTHDTREDFAEELEGLPVDPEQNFYRLQISINGNGFLYLDREDSKSPELDQYLFDGYSISIREGAKNFVLEHGLIADTSAEADSENDPVPYQDDRPAMTADWGEIPDRAVADEGRLLRDVDGQMVASLVVPENLLKAFDADTLDELGVHFDDQNRVEIQVKTVGGEVRLDPHFAPDSYQDRFEVDLFDHHRDALQQEADKMVAAAAEAKAAMTSNIKVEGASDFADSNPTERSLLIRIGGEEFVVTAPIDESGDISKVEVDPDQIGYDPATDGGARYQQLSALLDEAREPVLQAIREYHANADQHILRDTGWTDSRTLAAGYCVIPEAEIDRVADDAEAVGSYLSSGDFRTAEGYPIRLDFDIKGNLEAAVIPGTKVSLNPVLEGSRDHFVEAKAHLADHGLVLSRADSGDYRVDYHSSSSNHRDGEHGSAQFADTVSGATEIGHKMAAEREQQVTTRFQNDAERFERQAA